MIDWDCEALEDAATRIQVKKTLFASKQLLQLNRPDSMVGKLEESWKRKKKRMRMTDEDNATP